MAKGIILTCHGHLATGLYSTIKMIAGEFDNLRICEFHEGDNFENLDEDLVKAYESLGAYKDVVVLTDLPGGTPFNRSVMNLSEKNNIEFLAGVNFAMLYEALSSDIDDMKEFIEDVIETSHNSIVHYQNDQKDNDEEDFSDGI